MDSRLYKVTNHTLSRWEKQGIRPSEIKFRRGGRFSSADGDIAKALLNRWDEYSPEAQQALIRDYPEYINQIESIRKERDTSVTENDSVKEIVKTIHEKIDPYIREQEKLIDKKMRKRHEFIHNEKNTLSGEEFVEKYGEQIRSSFNKGRSYWSMDKFNRSGLGRLLAERNPDDLIKKHQKAYRQKEEDKVVTLFSKLQRKYPQVETFELTSFNSGIDGLEFGLTGWDKEKNEYKIHTNTITAGGYNIQILHLRWLMSVTDITGKTVKIKQN